MIIKNINYNEKNSLFEIELDVNEILSISYEIYEEMKLKSDMYLNLEEYKILLEESEYQKAKKMVERFINYKDRTEFELINKIKQSTNNDEVINKVINYYKNLGLIDDKKYAYNYIKYYLENKNLSKKDVIHKLINRGIKKNIIDDIILNYDDEIDYINAKNIFQNKYENLDFRDIKNIQKVHRYMASKGFDYYIVKNLIEEAK